MELRGEAWRRRGVGRISKRLLAPLTLDQKKQDRGDGGYEVELYHEWVTKTSPEHGLSNVPPLRSPHVFHPDATHNT